MLPHLDDHGVLIAASREATWSALGELHFSGPVVETYARLIGCEDVKPSGPRPLSNGSAFPGFHVVSSVRGRELALAGRHRFAGYQLTFRVAEDPSGGTLLEAESRAEFPGLHGRTYRFLLMRTGAHVFFVRRMLRLVKRRAETIAVASENPAGDTTASQALTDSE